MFACAWFGILDIELNIVDLLAQRFALLNAVPYPRDFAFSLTLSAHNQKFLCTVGLGWGV